MNILKVFLFSVVATIASFSIALIASMYIPVVPSGQEPSASINQKYYSMEEAKKIERKVEERIAAIRERNKDIKGIDFVRQAREPFLWFSWLPWVLATFVVNIKFVSHILSLLVFPVLFALIGLLAPIEILMFSVAVIVGLSIRIGVVQIEQLKGPCSNKNPPT